MARLLVIGDIHGCTRALDALIQVVKPEPADLIVTLGDYVDRGPDSRGAIERLLMLHASFRVVSLRGNHELMMMSALTGVESMQFWTSVGGRETLLSYSPIGRLRAEQVPDTHWRFLRRTCVDWYESDRFFFVHANVDPDLPLDRQPSSMLHWEHFNQFTPPHCSGKIMLCGHSEQRNGLPLQLEHAICVDTWCYGGGWLCCLDVLSGRYWQANQRGETRTSALSMSTIRA